MYIICFLIGIWNNFQGFSVKMRLTVFNIHLRLVCLAFGYFMLLTGCTSDELQGEKSLEGVWSVNNIESQYADYSVENGSVIGSNNTAVKSESGSLGLFTFKGNQVTYNFTRNDTTYSGSGIWELELAKVNSGFTKVNQWTLNIANDFVFDLRFDDSTKNAEKNADSMELDNWPKSSGYGVTFFMKLEKL
jgi:hypothetical protein